MSFGRFGMEKELLHVGRHELLASEPPARVKTNELIAKHVHTRGFVLFYTCIM